MRIISFFSYTFIGEDMKRRIHLKKRIKLNQKTSKINFIIYTIIGIIISIFLLFHYINKKVSPILLDYAEMESKKLASIIVSKAINDEIAKELTVEN